jgi:hypothetical protein
MVEMVLPLVFRFLPTVSPSLWLRGERDTKPSQSLRKPPVFFGNKNHETILFKYNNNKNAL